jgi:hypothetical protein
MPTFKFAGALFIAWIWISISEFVRNQFLLQSYWVQHYSHMGLVFPASPANGAVWGLWSLVFAGVIGVVAQKFSLWQTTALAWVFGFVMMWLVIGNLNVLPYGILFYAIPLSMLEAFVAAWIIKKMAPANQ